MGFSFRHVLTSPRTEPVKTAVRYTCNTVWHNYLHRSVHASTARLPRNVHGALASQVGEDSLSGIRHQHSKQSNTAAVLLQCHLITILLVHASRDAPWFMYVTARHQLLSAKKSNSVCQCSIQATSQKESEAKFQPTSARCIPQSQVGRHPSYVGALY